MTIKQYLNGKKQPIDTETNDSGIYVNCSVLQIIPPSSEHKLEAEIYVKRLDKDLYAFGWKLRDGKKLDFRNCTKNVITKGRIDKLLYGMTKVLIHRATKSLMTKEMIARLRMESYSASKLVKDVPDKKNVITL